VITTVAVQVTYYPSTCTATVVKVTRTTFREISDIVQRYIPKSNLGHASI